MTRVPLFHNLLMTCSNSKIYWIQLVKCEKYQNQFSFCSVDCSGSNTQVPLATIKPLTSSRNFSASDALPAATHWKVAFCPALTSSSPSLEKCGALSKETDRQTQSEIKRLHYLSATHNASQLQGHVFYQGFLFFQIHKQEFQAFLLDRAASFVQC